MSRASIQLNSLAASRTRNVHDRPSQRSALTHRCMFVICGAMIGEYQLMCAH
jgi:hypothetical protein